MIRRPRYEVVQRGSVWVLQRPDRTQLVQFPTRRQAIRAGMAVCQDEGMDGLLIRALDGTVQELDAAAAGDGIDH